ncbi:MAG: hypothetical protein KDD53_05120 [Bdellovibrionales bacterium]|nr:hypothetical protein [Bdellovibrionales bacterium]
MKEVFKSGSVADYAYFIPKGPVFVNFASDDDKQGIRTNNAIVGTLELNPPHLITA